MSLPHCYEEIGDDLGQENIITYSPKKYHLVTIQEKKLKDLIEEKFQKLFEKIETVFLANMQQALVVFLENQFPPPSSSVTTPYEENDQIPSLEIMQDFSSDQQEPDHHPDQCSVFTTSLDCSSPHEFSLLCLLELTFDANNKTASDDPLTSSHFFSILSLYGKAYLEQHLQQQLYQVQFSILFLELFAHGIIVIAFDIVSNG